MNASPHRPLLCGVLCLLVFASGCGDGNSGPAERDDDTRSNVVEAEVEQPSVTEPDIVAGIEQQGEEEQTTAGQESLPVRLGDRFDWCADVQAGWDAYDQTLAVKIAAEGEHQRAVDAFEAATDELDRAEAGEIVDAANSDVASARYHYQDDLEARFWQVSGARTASGESSWQVAEKRAWDALIENSPPTRAAATGLETAEEVLGQARTDRDAINETLSKARTMYEYEVSTDGILATLRLASQAGADPARISALTDTVTARFDASEAARATREQANIAAYEAVQAGAVQAGTAQSMAEFLQEALQPDRSARLPLQAMYDHWAETGYAHIDIEAAETAEVALDAAERAVENVLIILDSYDAWNDAFAVAEQVIRDAESAKAAAETSLEESLYAVILDTEAYTAFKRSLEGSCR